MLSPFPYFVITAMLLLISGLFVRCIPFYYRQLSLTTNHHIAIDGLRGFLAFGVFFHHVVIAYYAQRSGVWAESPSRFYTLTGQVGVSLFFAVTGFLFWEKIIKSKGKLPLTSYALARVRRLVPAYLLSLVLVLLAITLPIGNISLANLRINDVGDALMFKGIRTASDVNGVYWTLIWEWRFYFLLPIAALFWRGFRPLIVLMAVGLYVYFYPSKLLIINFMIGGVAATLAHKYQWHNDLKRPLASVLALGALGAVFACFDSAYGVIPSLLLLLFFVPIAHGNSLFGLLSNRPALLLGTVSYSVYLLHCIVLYVCIHMMNRVSVVAEFSALDYWVFASVIAVAVIGVAMLSYRFVEYPFLRKR